MELAAAWAFTFFGHGRQRRRRQSPRLLRLVPRGLKLEKGVVDWGGAGAVSKGGEKEERGEKSRRQRERKWNQWGPVLEEGCSVEATAGERACRAAVQTAGEQNGEEEEEEVREQMDSPSTMLDIWLRLSTHTHYSTRKHKSCLFTRHTHTLTHIHTHTHEHRRTLPASLPLCLCRRRFFFFTVTAVARQEENGRGCRRAGAAGQLCLSRD